MKLDLSQFNDIDFENIGGWPNQVKTFFAILLALCAEGSPHKSAIA